MDLVNWCTEQFNIIKNDFKKRLLSLGLHKMNLVFIPTSSITGYNIHDTLSKKITGSQDETLQGALDALDLPLKSVSNIQ